ncbi:hypothetical protein QE406_000966 [Microbacterium testaceum]|nr:hypothetical protein [Microbacterium sp. SORGH_AS_0969]MDQ1114957.1 hypothetical protein [Microbacterium testaceum]
MTPALAAALARAEASNAACGPTPAPEGRVSKTRRIDRAASGVSWTLDRNERGAR